MNDSRGFQDVESICSGKLSHIPSQPAVVPSLCGMLSRDQNMPPDTGNFVSDAGNVFGKPRAMSDSAQIPSQGIRHATNQVES